MATDPKRTGYLTDYWTLEDALSFSDFRQALLTILTEADTPLTVGVFGPWGSGKTSLMRMLKADTEAKGLHFVRPVWFTAWKYDQHEALWRAFILRVLDALYPREAGEGPWEKRARLRNPQGEQLQQVRMLERLEQSVYGAVDWEELGRWTVNWWQATKSGGKAAAEVAAALIPGGAALATALGQVLGGNEEADVLRREIQTYHRQQLASMEQFHDTFEEAIKLVLKDEGRLVVFVDDLDRCLPEKAVEVLEAVKLFLEVPRTVFVLGMDREVIERGIEARYAALFRTGGEGQPELRIRGSAYLEKIVQIPFHLPTLAVDDVEHYIQRLEQGLPGSMRLSEPTRAVLANGLSPNPRQVKRTLNIFRLLKEIALAREESERLPKGSVAWPLLAKTVLIQTQWIELYRQWRQYPTLVQTLEAEYTRRPSTEQEALRGRRARPTGEAEHEEEAQSESVMGAYLRDRRRYALLERMLCWHPDEASEDERHRVSFEGLTREQMSVYVRLAGTVERDDLPLVEVALDVLEEMLSGDRVRIRDAVARLAEAEPQSDGDLHRSYRGHLLRAMRDSARPAGERVSAGDALSLVGDSRFRADAWYLPDEPLLGFLEIPAGPFCMGTSEEDVARLAQQFEVEEGSSDREVPQHEVELPRYFIARYPVTVAQFRAFVDASGWVPKADNSLTGLDSHPVGQVTWLEALAYCRWLTEQLRAWEETPAPLATRLRRESWEVMLPSEAQWEKAARGEDGRTFPWGEMPDPNRANYGITGIGTTSSVGCFPGGGSPYGVEEMSGNTWEWTRSLWGPIRRQPQFGYPYDPTDGREDLEADVEVRRVLRGGSFDSVRWIARCAFRFSYYPHSDRSNLGFRVVVSPVSPNSAL